MADNYVALELTGSQVTKVGRVTDKDPVSKWANDKNYILVDYFQWGARRSGSTSANAGGAQGGRASYFDVPLSKRTDQSTAELLNHCSSGKVIPKATFRFYKDDPSTKGKAVDKVVKMLTLHNVTVVGLDVGTEMVDRVTLSYTSFEWEILGGRVAEEKIG